MSEILGIVAIIMVGLCIVASHISIRIVHIHRYEHDSETPPPPLEPYFSTPVDPGYDEKGDLTEQQEESKYNLDELLRVVNGVMLDEEELNER